MVDDSTERLHTNNQNGCISVDASEQEGQEDRNNSTPYGENSSWLPTMDSSCNVVSNSHSRIRSITGRHEPWTCFLCLHVRTGTIIIGFWYMVC